MTAEWSLSERTASGRPRYATATVSTRKCVCCLYCGPRRAREPRNFRECDMCPPLMEVDDRLHCRECGGRR